MSEHKPDDTPAAVPSGDEPTGAKPEEREAAGAREPLPGFLAGAAGAGPSPVDGRPSNSGPVHARAASRQGNAWWVWILVGIAAAAAWWGWQQYAALQSAERQVAEWQNVADMLSGRIEALDGELGSVRERQRSIETRIGENAATARVIREEMLAISERSEVVEEALARLTSQREQADVAMRLNEIDFLLQLGQQRFELYGDRGAAEDAFATAEQALTTLQIGALAAVQQTLAAERAAIAGLPEDVAPSLRARLGELRLRLPGLPPPPSEPVLDADQPRVLQLLSRLITVRRIGEHAQLLTPLERGSRLAALQLQVDLALAALERGDQSSWNERLDAAQSLFAGLFDAESPETVAARHVIDEARAARIARPELALGAALRELRAVRGMPRLPDLRSGSGVSRPPAPTESLEVE